jgi:hypothetical protein
LLDLAQMAQTISLFWIILAFLAREKFHRYSDTT